MTHVAVASMVRDSQSWGGREIRQVDRFFAQFGRQQGMGGAFRLTFHIVEGDSTDDTRAAVERAMATWEEAGGEPAGELLEFHNGGPAVASLASEARFKSLSKVANVALRAARDSGADYVLWVESDLIFGDDLVARLLEGFARFTDVGLVAPLAVFTHNGADQFYDTWAYEGYGGARYGNHDLARLKAGDRYKGMNSVGCCALMSGPVLRAGSIDFGEGCFPALCASLRAAGTVVVLDSGTEIRHPSSELVASRLI